jgi:UDP-N-acetylmuramoylalanine--D-glutamate ligase
MKPFDQFKQDYQGKKVLIMGLGLLGSSVGLTKVLAQIGCHLRITDIKSEAELAPSLKKLEGIKADYIFGEHHQADVDWAQIIVRGAAVPWEHSLLQYARDQNKPIVMDAQLFAHYAKECIIIGVTGTRGKTTTTHLIYELLKKVPRHRVLLGGNVKDVATTPLLKKITNPKKTIAVLELSSWQLQAFNAQGISPHHAVLTNVYPDHLNTYSSLKKYYQDKQAIYKHQTKNDYCYLNHHVKEFRFWVKDIKSQIIWYQKSDIQSYVTLNLPGEHNLQNAAAAKAVAISFKLSENTINSVLQSFKPLAHRLQTLRVLNDITFVNDTTSTTPIATIKALDSIKAPIVLIGGGSDKNLPLKKLANHINKKAHSVILLTGNGTNRLAPLLDQQKIIITTSSLKEAVRTAVDIAPKGSTILLSPGFTSFGLFKNEYDRGDQFINLVNDI